MTAKEARARTLELKTTGKLPVFKRNSETKPDTKINPVTVSQTCVNFGDATGETEACGSCRGKVSLRVYACAAFGTCTVGKAVSGRGTCSASCPSYVKKDS